MSATPVSFEKYLTDRFVTREIYDAMPPADQHIWRTDYDAYIALMSSGSTQATTESHGSFQNFRQFLLSVGRTLEVETATLIKTRMPSRVGVVESVDDAVMLLEDATRLPHATTVARIFTSYGLILDSEFAQSRRSTLIRAFSMTTRKPKMMKFTDDAPKEYAIFTHLGISSEMSAERHLVPLEQCIEDEHGKKAVVMPMYSCTIGTPPYMPEESVLLGMREILKGLETLHASGIIHNDIKPGNVLMDTDGSWHICDYGSCTTPTTPHTQRVDYTPMYIPHDFKTRRTRGFDYMLAIVTALDTISTIERKFSGQVFSLQTVHDKILAVESTELKDLLLSLFENRTVV